MSTHAQERYVYMSTRSPNPQISSGNGFYHQSSTSLAYNYPPTTASVYPAHTTAMLGQQMHGFADAGTAAFDSDSYTNQRYQDSNQFNTPCLGQSYSGSYDTFSHIQGEFPYSNLQKSPSYYHMAAPSKSGGFSYQQLVKPRQYTKAIDVSAQNSQTLSIERASSDRNYGICESPTTYSIGDRSSNAVFSLGPVRSRSNDRPNFTIEDFGESQQGMQALSMEPPKDYDQPIGGFSDSPPKPRKSSTEFRRAPSLRIPDSTSDQRSSSAPKPRGRQANNTNSGQPAADESLLLVPGTSKHERKNDDHQPRQRALTPEGRRHASEVRKLHACKECKRRKVRVCGARRIGS